MQATIDDAISPEQAVKLCEYLFHIKELEAYKVNIEQKIFLFVEPFSDILALFRTTLELASNPMTVISVQVSNALVKSKIILS